MTEESKSTKSRKLNEDNVVIEPPNGWKIVWDVQSENREQKPLQKSIVQIGLMAAFNFSSVSSTNTL